MSRSPIEPSPWLLLHISLEGHADTAAPRDSGAIPSGRQYPSDGTATQAPRCRAPLHAAGIAPEHPASAARDPARGMVDARLPSASGTLRKGDKIGRAS